MDIKYKPTIGLEVHAELKTKTKMFCACKNDSDEERPNVNICPVCMGHPGTLPVINKEAVRSVLKVGLAIGGELARFSEFDRKNYFYPDIPKGYQISQYKYPLVSGGELAGVSITRVHLEEDTGTSSHDGEHSLVNFNRAGVPLMELVTEPVMHSSEEVVHFGKELQMLLQYLEVAEANMEKGEMRLEANISVAPQRSDLEEGPKGQTLGTKVEVKNLNSFRAAERAVEYEIKRQTELLESGGKVDQETRGWNEGKQSTFSQRSKEDSHDYRYFPDPDLPKLNLSLVPEFDKEVLMSQLKETPNQKRDKFKKDYSIKESDVEFYISSRDFSNLFEASAKELAGGDFQLLSNYVVSDLSGIGEKALKISPEDLAELIKMAGSGEVSSRGAKDIIAKMIETGEAPKVIAEKSGLFQKSDEGELLAVVEKIVGENPEVVTEYKAGKAEVLQFLVGQGMKASKGSANPKVLADLFKQKLS